MKGVDEKLNGGKEGSGREGREERLNIGRNVCLILGSNFYLKMKMQSYHYVRILHTKTL